MTSVAVATSSQLAADAAHEVAAAGGNAVDCALAAALLTMNTEPGVCALAGGAFVTIWQDGSDPVTIDGNVAVPGSGRTGVLSDRNGKRGAVRVAMDYGGGVETLVGCASVAVPGSLAALEHAWKRYGATDWQTIFAPTVRATRDGFPLSSACHYYLRYSGTSIFGRSADGYGALHDPNGALLDIGSPIVIPHLADTLEAISKEGARLLYEGELAAAIAEHCHRDGLLTRDDLRRYTAIERRSLMTQIGDWRIASNPPPAVGGAVLAAMLMTCAEFTNGDWNRENLTRLIESQRSCLDYRKSYLDLSDDVEGDVLRLLESARNGQLLSHWASASTVHTSAVDADGNGCAITASSGYGSGEMPIGTGLWLNNCLGEIELNRRGLDAGPVGARLPSNMAPCVAQRAGAVLAVGSPGADRITTALQQFLISYLQFEMSLEEAIAHPRLHIDTSSEDVRLKAEPGLDLPHTDLATDIFSEQDMYFGGVTAAVLDSTVGLSCAADPRREGGTCIYSG